MYKQFNTIVYDQKALLQLSFCYIISIHNSHSQKYNFLLTQAAGGQEPHRVFRRRALRKKGLRRVLGEGEGHDRLGSWPDDQDGHPEPEEGGQRPERHPYVRVIAPRPRDRRPQLRVAQRAQRGEDAREGPDEEGDADAVDAQVDAGRRHEDAAADYSAHDQGDAVPEGDLPFELDGAGATDVVVVVVLAHRMALCSRRARGSTTACTLMYIYKGSVSVRMTMAVD